MMATGTVKFFNTQKGFGFIQPTDGSKDVFVHISAVERGAMRTLVEGRKIRYDAGCSSRGVFFVCAVFRRPACFCGRLVGKFGGPWDPSIVCRRTRAAMTE